MINRRGVQVCFAVFVSGRTTNYLHNAVVGLSAVAGFLLVVFVAVVAQRICRKKYDRKR